MSELAYLGIAEAAELLRAGKLSPVTYTEALIDRIARLDGRFHAFIRPTPDLAVAAAKDAEREIAAGRWRGPLHGIPFALKDIIDWAGLPTTAHSKLLIDNIASRDAFVSQRLRAAGGIMLGKLATHEFAIGRAAFRLPPPPAGQSLGRLPLPGGSSSRARPAPARGTGPAA